MQIKIEVKSRATKKPGKEIKEFDFFYRETNYSLRSFNNFQSLPESKNLSDRMQDLLNITNILLYIDRFTRRGKNPKLSIHLKFPVRDLFFWQQQNIKEELSDLVYYFTELNWKIEFYQDINENIFPNQKLEFLSNDELEICLWSGGLDALAGLINRIHEFPYKKFILASFEANSRKKNIQKEICNELKKIHPNIRSRIYFHNTPKHKQKKEYPYARTRGLFFLFSGLVLASTLNQKKLYLYENGVGALNLMLPGNTGLDQSITSTYESFCKCSSFFEKVIGEKIQIENPFAFKTKSEMCKILDNPLYAKIVSITNSCDGPYRDKPSECGYCTACILRRLSLFNSGIQDGKEYVVQKFGDLLDKKEYNCMYGQYVLLKDTLERDDMNELFRQQPGLYNSIEYSGLSDKEFKSKLKTFLKNYLEDFESFHKLVERENFKNHSYLMA